MQECARVRKLQLSPKIDSAQCQGDLSLSVRGTDYEVPDSGTTGERPIIDRLDRLAERMAKIEVALTGLIEQRTIKEWYSTAEVARILAKAEFTVREWCRLGRVNAKK